MQQKREDLKVFPYAQDTLFSNLLFIDSILIFCEGNTRYAKHLEGLLSIFCKATGMSINKEKSTFLSQELLDQKNYEISQKLSLSQ
jgi:hypothetical protein